MSINANELDLFSDILTPADEIRIEVSGANGDRVFVFDAMDSLTYKNYNDTISGRGRRKGDPWKAGKYVFQRKCKQVEGLTENEQAQLDAKNITVQAAMLADSKYLPMIDQIIGRYISVAVPDAESMKSPRDSD